MLTVAPHLNDAKFQPLVNSFARITLLGLDSYEFLRERGLVGENRELRSSVDAVQRLIGVQLKLAKRARPIAGSAQEDSERKAGRFGSGAGSTC